MNVADLYTKLAVGELKNLAMAEGGTIREADRPTIIRWANEGLLKLYTRFQLKEGDLLLEQIGYRTKYPLEKKHAFSSEGQPDTGPYFINDIGEEFADDVIKVLSVTDAYGRIVPLNAEHLMASVFTPQPKVLQIPNPTQGVVMGIHYQAAHAKLSGEDDEQIIELPEFLMEALTSFITQKVCSGMNTQEMTAKAAEHAGTFETICVEARELNLVTTGATTGGYRFEKNGWV